MNRLLSALFSILPGDTDANERLPAFVARLQGWTGSVWERAQSADGFLRAQTRAECVVDTEMPEGFVMPMACEDLAGANFGFARRIRGTSEGYLFVLPPKAQEISTDGPGVSVARDYDGAPVWCIDTDNTSGSPVYLMTFDDYLPPDGTVFLRRYTIPANGSLHLIFPTATPVYPSMFSAAISTTPGDLTIATDPTQYSVSVAFYPNNF